MGLPFTAIGTDHLHGLQDRAGFYFCLDVMWFDGRIVKISGYSCNGPRWYCDEDFTPNAVFQGVR